MLSGLNSPLMLSLIFPTGLLVVLSLIISKLPLGDRKAALFPAAMLFAVLSADVLAFGFPAFAPAYGLRTLFFMMLIWGGVGILLNLWVHGLNIRLGAEIGVLVVLSWFSVGLPMGLETALQSFGVQLVFLFSSMTFVLRTGGEIDHFDEKATPFLILFMISLVLTLFAHLLGQAEAVLLGAGLVSLAFVCCVCAVSPFKDHLHRLAGTLLALALAGLGWGLWLLGAPLLSLLSLCPILFARHAVAHFLTDKPVWVQKGYYLYVLGYGLLCAVISLVFFDVFAAL